MSLFLSRPSASTKQTSNRQHQQDVSLERALRTLSTPIKSPLALTPRQHCNSQRRRKSMNLQEVVKEKDNQLRALQEKYHNCKSEKENQVQTLQNHLNMYMASAEKMSQKKGADSSIMDIVRCLEGENSSESINNDSDDENDSAEILELKIKVENANKLIASLEHQVDDLTSQKNDALDWIEELFAKAELRDKKMKQSIEERNSALSECERLRNANVTTEAMLNRAISDLEQARKDNELLKSENHDTTTKSKSLEEELAATLEKMGHLTKDSLGESKIAFEEFEARIEELHSALEREKGKHLDTQNELQKVKVEIEESNLKEARIREKFNSVLNECEKLKNEVANTKDLHHCAISELETRTKENDQLKSDNLDMVEKLKSFEKLAAAMENTLCSTEIVEQSEETQDRFYELQSRSIALCTELENQNKKVTELNEENVSLKKKISDDACNTEIREKFLLGRATQAEEEFAQMKMEYNKELQRLGSENASLIEEKEIIHKKLREMQSKRNPAVLFMSSKNAQHSSLAVSEMILELEQIARESDLMKSENLRLKAERRHLCDKIQKDDENTMRSANLRRELKETVEKLQLQLQRATDDLRKSEDNRQHLLSQIDAKNAMISEAEIKTKSLLIDLNELRRSNNDLARNEKELRDSIARSENLLRDLTSENSELKEKNDSFQRTNLHLEKQSKELEELLSSALNERDTASNEMTRFKRMSEELEAANDILKDDLRILSNLRDGALYEREKMRLKHDKLIADCHADLEQLKTRVQYLSNENQQLESQLAILNASKYSVQEKADRILENDNALHGKFDRLKVDFKKQSMTVAGLQDEVYRLRRRLQHLQVENDRLTQENDKMTQSLLSLERVSRDSKDAEDTKVGRKIPFFGIRGAK